VIFPVDDPVPPESSGMTRVVGINVIVVVLLPASVARSFVEFGKRVEFVGKRAGVVFCGPISAVVEGINVDIGDPAIDTLPVGRVAEFVVF